MNYLKQLFVPIITILATVIVDAAPQVPEARIYDVRDFGAKADGKAVDSDSINEAILAAAKQGGGTVYFGPGTYLSASIRLKSNITLYLEAGSVIEAVDYKKAAYDLPEANEWGTKYQYQDFGHSHWKNSLIWGIGLENVSIVGPGLIHGKGLNRGFNRFADEDKGERRYQDGGPKEGNKAIALKLCRNVTLRDFSILHGGHFGVLATGVDNMLIDNLKIDTNRDAIDIDACNNVRVINTSINSPWDDGICLKSSFGLGYARDCENITIANCYLSGNFDEGTMLDGTFKRSRPEYKSYTTGRIKFGTESNGDFKNITITNCVFDESRGIAIESVDGSNIEDVAISNITMRKATNDPIFIRLGSRMRGPEGVPVGSIKRISINNVVVSGAANACTISGVPGHPIEDVRISDVFINYTGGGAAALGSVIPRENEKGYPEPGMFGPTPAWGFYVRHVEGFDLSHAKLTYENDEYRPAIVLSDVTGAYFDHNNLQESSGDAPAFQLRDVRDFVNTDTRGAQQKAVTFYFRNAGNDGN